METSSEKAIQQVDFKKVISAIWQYKILYVKVLSIVFLVSSIYILPIPRTYTCSVMLAPELSGTNVGGTLSSLASSFGVDLGSAMSQDAIFPTLYPDLMGSTDFLVSLFPIQVTTEDGELTTTYCDYLRFHQKQSIWSLPFQKLRNFILSFFEENEQETFTGTDQLDAFRLTKQQQKVVKAISNNIDCSVDKKTDVITIMVTDQDPLVCASMADTLSVRLQDFITDYRTNKARIDLDYYQSLAEKAKMEYDAALATYGKYVDSHINVAKESYRLEMAKLENEMQLKLSAYTTLNTQLQMARAKVQERTPAFTTLQGATVPIRPTSPKRMFFVLIMCFLAFVGTSGYVLMKIVR